MVLCGVEVYGGLHDPPVWPGMCIVRTTYVLYVYVRYVYS